MLATVAVCCSIRQQRAALQNPAHEQRWERWLLHRLLPTLPIHYLKRKSEEHKEFPLSSHRGWEFWSQLCFSRVFISLCLSLALFPPSLLSLLVFPLFFPLSLLLPVWGLVCLSLLYCFFSTWEVRLFSHLAASDWRSPIPNEGVVTLNTTSFIGCVAGWTILFSP